MTDHAREAVRSVIFRLWPYSHISPTQRQIDLAVTDVQLAIDSATAELKARYCRSLEDVSKERGELRKVAARLAEENRGLEKNLREHMDSY